MVQKNVAEKATPAKPRRNTKTQQVTPRLQVTVHEEADTLGPDCSSSPKAFAVVGRELGQADREHFMILHLNSKSRLLAKETISIGSLNASIVHPREVFRGAVMHGSAAIILAHNHPSGDFTPSREDIELTSRLCDVGALLGITVLDHIIVGGSWYYSFADGKKMPTASYSRGSDFKENGEFKRANLKDLAAASEVDEIRSRLSFFSCLDWEALAENDEAQGGFCFLVRDVEERLKNVSEMIYPTGKSKHEGCQGGEYDR